MFFGFMFLDGSNPGTAAETALFFTFWALMASLLPLLVSAIVFESTRHWADAARRRLILAITLLADVIAVTMVLSIHFLEMPIPSMELFIFPFALCRCMTIWDVLLSTYQQEKDMRNTDGIIASE